MSRFASASASASRDLSLHQGTAGIMPVNGKVERVQRTVLEAFWPTVDPKDPDLATQLDAWRTSYNDRPHGSLAGRTPAKRVAELATKIPAPEALQTACDPRRELIRPPSTRHQGLPTKAPVT